MVPAARLRDQYAGAAVACLPSVTVDAVAASLSGGTASRPARADRLPARALAGRSPWPRAGILASAPPGVAPGTDHPPGSGLNLLRRPAGRPGPQMFGPGPFLSALR